MSDYIKREDALNGCKQWLEPKERDELDTMWNHGIEACLNEIKHHTPTVNAVEVVRCKDCKHYHKDDMMPVHPMLGGGTVIENHCDMSCMKLKDDDYCSYGERKDDECE